MSKMSVKIPTTGRLGSLARTISEVSGEDVLNEVFQDYKPSLKGKEQSEWVLNMIKKLEKNIGTESTIKIIEIDGRKSCGNGFKNTVRKLKAKSNTIKEFVDNLGNHYKRSSFFQFIDDNTIVGGHNKCYMMIKSAPKPIDSKIFCHFCVGHGKEFYETALQKPLDVEIIETVMTGGATCKFIIKIKKEEQHDI